MGRFGGKVVQERCANVLILGLSYFLVLSVGKYFNGKIFDTFTLLTK